MLAEITNADILEEIRANRRELRSVIDAAEARLSLRLEESNRRVQQLEEENERLRNRVEYLDRTSRASNVIITGLQVPEGSNVPTFVVGELSRLMGIKLCLADLSNAYLIGRSDRKLVKVEFVSYLRRLEVLKSSHKLKGTEIYVNSDLTFKERQESRALREQCKQERARGVKCYLRGGKLFMPKTTRKSSEVGNPDHNSAQRPNSEPSSVVSTPDVNDTRIFKTHQLVIPKKVFNDSDSAASLEGRIEDNTAAVYGTVVVDQQFDSGLVKTGTVKKTTLPRQEYDAPSQRTRKGSGSNSQRKK